MFAENRGRDEREGVGVRRVVGSTRDEATRNDLRHCFTRKRRRRKEGLRVEVLSLAASLVIGIWVRAGRARRGEARQGKGGVCMGGGVGE